RSAKLYAEEINGGEYNWRRGLCDALAAIASENHGNLVWGMAYCNALQANGHLYEWNQGHIHFTPAESWYQPSGHVVKMLGEHFQPVVVKTEVTGPRLTVSLAGERGEENVESSALVACAAQSRDGKRLAVKVVSLWGGEVSTSLTLAGTTPPAKIAVRAIGSMHLAGRNTVDKQDYIAPHGLAVPAPSGNSILVKLPPMSFTIIEVQWRD
ncbi:MAG: alpha-L-arabinofuranosidase C-terminal domain-containing protein, partial [Tepidisphaeraceae bacterium]